MSPVHHFLLSYSLISFQDELRSLQRELENRDERIRRLEVQLRGAYLGVNNAMRAGLRDSQITGDPDDMSDVGEMQNLLELHISEATVFVGSILTCSLFQTCFHSLIIKC